MLRVIIVLLLGIGFALGVYYGGGMQWMADRWSNYWNAPVAVVQTPMPVPIAAYPGIAPAAPVVPPAPYYPNGQDYIPPSDVAAPPQYGPENGEAPDDAAPVESEPAYAPPDALPPVGVAPIGAGPPLSLHISIGRRVGYSADCIPAYTVFNDTQRPIILTERTHYRWNGRGRRDETIVQPGERQIACAADVYRAGDADPRFDYYRQNIWYGPDAIDLPPAVNIRVKE